MRFFFYFIFVTPVQRSPFTRLSSVCYASSYINSVSRRW